MSNPLFPSSPSIVDPDTGEIRDILRRDVFLRSPFNYSMDSVSLETGLACPELTLTQQQFKDESDINNIMVQFGRGAALPESFRAPQYGDFTGVTDFQSALEAVRQAEASFMSMPAKLRAQFDNDPQLLVEFLGDPANRAKAQELGLVHPDKPDVPAVPSQPPASS